MHLAGVTGRRGILLAAALFLCATAVSATELSLEMVYRSDLDLDRVIERTDGGFGLLRGGRIEAVSPDRSVTLLRAREEAAAVDVAIYDAAGRRVERRVLTGRFR